MTRRELAAQACVAALFVIAAGILLIFGDHEGVDPLDLVLLVGATALLGRLEFEIGGGFTVPTQLLFVPMLFVLPPAIPPSRRRRYARWPRRATWASRLRVS